MIPAPDLEGRWRLLADRAVFRISGSDRLRYLNGQVTNDVARASDSVAIPACICTIKGKVEALVWIRADGDTFLIDGEPAQREALHARLERYLIADDCEIEDISDQVRVYHHFLGVSGGGVSSRRLRIPGWDLILSREAACPFPQEAQIAASEWALEEILSALPGAGLEIRSDEFPAELGLDSLAVDFHKGCYLGQEIISRIRSVGRVKRILKVIESDRPLAAGDSVTASSGEKGIVTRASEPGERGKQFSLALFSLPSAESAISDPDAVVIV